MNYRAALACEKIKFQRDKGGVFNARYKIPLEVSLLTIEIPSRDESYFSAVRTGEEPISIDCWRSINNHAFLACYLRVLNESRDIRGTVVCTLKTDLSGRKQSVPMMHLGFIKVVADKIIYHPNKESRSMRESMFLTFSQIFPLI